jgi:Cft2 family RNA processing exonuclease
MFSYDSTGIKLIDNDFWLDAHRKVSFSFVSHGHTDHLKNHDKIIATPPTIQFHAMRARQKAAIPLAFGQSFTIDDYTLELYPAGHILGSAMIRIVKDGVSLLYTGDFKLKESRTAETIQIPQSDILIMESTFGDPSYVNDRSLESLEHELLFFVDECIRSGKRAVVLAYNLGKAQEAMKILGDARLDVRVHPSAWELAKVYSHFGVTFQNCSAWDGDPLNTGQVLIYPPHLCGKRAFYSIPFKSTVFLSGWALNDGGNNFADHSIPISDHADFEELLQFVQKVNPQKVYTTHGFEQFPAILRSYGFDAQLLKTSDQFPLF